MFDHDNSVFASVRQLHRFVQKGEVSHFRNNKNIRTVEVIFFFFLAEVTILRTTHTSEL